MLATILSPGEDVLVEVEDWWMNGKVLDTFGSIVNVQLYTGKKMCVLIKKVRRETPLVIDPSSWKPYNS
jgi:hypothetical protein